MSNPEAQPDVSAERRRKGVSELRRQRDNLQAEVEQLKLAYDGEERANRRAEARLRAEVVEHRRAASDERTARARRDVALGEIALLLEPVVDVSNAVKARQVALRALDGARAPELGPDGDPDDQLPDWKDQLIEDQRARLAATWKRHDEETGQLRAVIRDRNVEVGSLRAHRAQLRDEVTALRDELKRVGTMNGNLARAAVENEQRIERLENAIRTYLVGSPLREGGKFMDERREALWHALVDRP